MFTVSINRQLSFSIKRLLLLLATTINAAALFAQTDLKVGTTPGSISPSAVFEAAATTKGMLIPRLTTAQMNAISAPSLGLMVFNTNLNCLHFYFSGWKSQCDPANLGAWSLLGNSGTTAGTNFVGTTDNISLTFKTNSVRSGYLGTSANNNVFMGYNAGATISTGTTNTLLGATADVTTGTLTNATALGFGASVDASNKIRLGNTSVTLVETYGSFVTVSDRRLKTHISDNAIGLNFIKAIRPVKYELKTQKGIVYDGFIAQEIDSILHKQNIKTFSGLSKPKNDSEHYSVSYSTFVVPLVNAVKELDAKNDVLATENDKLKAELARMKAENAALNQKVDKNAQDIEAIKAMLDKKQ